MLMGINMGNYNNNYMFRGVAVKGSWTNLSIIHHSRIGQCDKPDLPWLLATYEGEGGRGGEEKKTQKRETERGHVKMAMSTRISQGTSEQEKNDSLLYLH